MSDGVISHDLLRSLVERIERLEEEKQSLAEDVRTVYAEAKASGFDTKILRQVIRLRKQDSIARREEETVRDLYLHALGMISSQDEGDGVAGAEGASAGVDRLADAS